MELSLKDRTGNKKSFFVRYFNDLTKPNNIPQPVFVQLARYSRSLISVTHLEEIRTTTFFVVISQNQVKWTGIRCNSQGAWGQQILFSVEASTIFRDAAVNFLKKQNKKRCKVVIEEVYGLDSSFFLDESDRTKKIKRNRKLRRKQKKLDLVVSENFNPDELIDFLNRQSRPRQKVQPRNKKQTGVSQKKVFQKDLFDTTNNPDEPIL